MRRASETIGVDFVDVLGPRGPGGEPSVLGNHFEAAYRSLITGSFRQLRGNGLARQVRFLNRIGRELLQFCFLLGRGWRLNARVIRYAEFCSELAIMFSGIFASAGGNLRRQQYHYQSIFVS